MPNYTVYHIHSMLSNATTNIDSVTDFRDYVARCKELGMQGLAFTEHGNIFEFCHKKDEVEKAGMLYIHGVEAYLTDTLERGIRRAYHCVILAKNEDGFKELNRLVTKSYNRTDGHFFYYPRIHMDELEQTSNNLIITSACLGGPLNRGDENFQNRFIHFMEENKDRCFLEIQHHNIKSQIEYNKKLLQISHDTGIRLIAGTDTHALNETHMLGRKMLQMAKGVSFPDEDNWDLKFKSYDELAEAYYRQGAIPEDDWESAIENTNLLLDMCESYNLDNSIKYPKIYPNSVQTFKDKINEGYKTNPYVKRHPKDVVINRIREEEAVYEKVGAIDFMLLMRYIKEWEIDHGIHTGPGRGSVSGSYIAYLLGITDMDSIKFNLNFFRFLNPGRVTNADIDIDHDENGRSKLKDFLLKDHLDLPNVKTAEIITFNTIKLKGAIKDIGRALKMDLELTQEISNAVETDEKQRQFIDEKWRKKYPELFRYADIVNGVIISVGTHPSGVLVSDTDIESNIGLCSISSTPYPVTSLNMKELDQLFYVKLDVLGLDNVALINKTCELAGIDILTPDTVDLEDEKVWESIRDDTTGIFQWSSEQATAYIKKFMSSDTLKAAKERNPNFSMLKWFSFGNGLLRPSCASFRDDVANGKFYENGLKELDDFLAQESGRLAMQESTMQFLVKFCGYSDAESDTVRRCVSGDTEISVYDGKKKKIRDLSIGDIVLTVDEKAFVPSYKRVNNVFDNGIQKVYGILAYDGKREYRIKATKSHKFMTTSGYKMLSDLHEGSHLVVMPRLSLARICAIKELGEEHVYDIEVEENHNYIANDIWVHNCIAKKKGTEQLLPEIEERFVEYSSKNYGISKEKCAEVIKPFLQVIQDASNYGFSWNHSDAYSCIGYICGYLRYYYPTEFITAGLNVFQDKPDKFAPFVEYANKHGIKIEPPRFGYSTYEYIYNKDRNVITKGLGSIKYINEDCARTLYDMRFIKFDTFTDLLVYMDENTAIDKRQIRTLIQLNFFKDFGKNGKLISIFDYYIERYKKTYVEKTKVKRIEEIRAFEAEEPDKIIPIEEQIAVEEDLLGYIALSYPIDKRYCYVSDVNVRYNPFVDMYSIGAGKNIRVKIDKKAYEKQKVKKGEIIFAEKFVKKPDYIKTDDGFVQKGTYSFRLVSYKKVDKERFSRVLEAV